MSCSLSHVLSFLLIIIIYSSDYTCMDYEDNKIMIIDFSFIVLYVVVLALLYNIDLYMYYTYVPQSN